MKKPILFLIALVAFTSCTKESGSITGSWVTEMQDQPQHKYGFTLKDDGKAHAINRSDRTYAKWEKQGDLLILSGKNESEQEDILVNDTLKIISVGDSTLVLEKNGRKITYTKTENIDKLVTDFEIYACFVYKARKDSAFLHINIADSIVTGELFYSLFEKDKNQGKINGRLIGDTLLAQYTFGSEGMQSKREIAFLKRGANWVEGFGEVEEVDSAMVFKDRSKLNFRRGLLFRGVECPANQ